MKELIGEMVLLNRPELFKHFFSVKKYFMAKLYICIVLVNIRNIYVKYSHCGSIHFKRIIAALKYSLYLYMISISGDGIDTLLNNVLNCNRN